MSEPADDPNKPPYGGPLNELGLHSLAESWVTQKLGLKELYRKQDELTKEIKAHDASLQETERKLVAQAKHYHRGTLNITQGKGLLVRVTDSEATKVRHERIIE